MLGLIGLHIVFVLCGAAVLRALGLLRGRLLALGPALLTGVMVLCPPLILLLILGVGLRAPTVIAVVVVVLVLAELVARRRRGVAAPARPNWGVLLIGLYAALGAYSLARLPTIEDDARIWSLRGLALSYHHVLAPQIFQNPYESGTHPVYPLFGPVIEALNAIAAGAPQLRFYHAELWILFAAIIWTAAYLLGGRQRLWVAPLVLLAVSPAVAQNLISGYADVLGAALMGLGCLALGLWQTRGSAGYLAFGTVALIAAANTKDEDLLGAIIIFVVAVAANHRRWREWVAAGVALAVFIAPWRLWTAAHHLSDSVQPKLGQALSPSYLISRHHEVHWVLEWVGAKVVEEWSWIAVTFLVLFVLCMVTRTARRIAAFYLIALGLIALMLTWLYATTPMSLAFLFPTSMFRTVDDFMIPAAFASAHLLWLLSGYKPRPSVTLGSCQDR